MPTVAARPVPRLAFGAGNRFGSQEGAMGRNDDPGATSTDDRARGAIVVAAGRGRRMGTETRKAFLDLGGRPLYEYAVERLLACGGVADVVLVVHADDVEAVGEAWRRRGDARVRVVEGGAERWHSVRRGLAASRVRPDGIALVHDAARPFLDAALVRRVVEAAERDGAAIPARPVVDTLKRVDDEGFGGETVPREALVRVQTPQGFRRDLLERAFEAWDERRGDPTDESQVIEAAGGRVRVVDGSDRNGKITTLEDLEEARRRLADRAVRDESASRERRGGKAPVNEERLG